MNRTGLIIALTVAVAAGLLFGLFPRLDLILAALFYDQNTGHFSLRFVRSAELLRRSAMWISWTLAAPAIIAPILKLIWPRKPMIVSGRAVIFLLSTILLTAVILPNGIFKTHWGRPRPVATIEFNGSRAFTPWWDPRGTNPPNGSFFSGEAATAFWTYAPAALAPPTVRPIAFVAATLFGLTTGVFRMAFGAHYASDVLAAGVAAFLVTWLAHGVIYRWKTTRLSDEQIDRSFGEVITRARSSRMFSLIAIVTAITVVRLIGLRMSVVDLFPDEARYWAWAQAPAFGYFSKPPLIAWIIAAAGKLCGNSEPCVRAAAPLFYGGTAVLTALIARQIYGERTGFWTGLIIALATGVVFSARIMSTDVPLLFFWALAVLAYVNMREGETRFPWFIVLGLALGLGLLAKYAMIYFLLSALAAAILDPAARRMWRSRGIWLAIVLGAAVVMPNLIWNATHDFATFRHTQTNIVGGGLQLNPLGGLGFIVSQFAVCGPIVFSVFVIAMIRPARVLIQPIDRTMFMFALAPLVVVTAVGFVTSAKANWAAPAAVSMTILAVGILVREKQWRWLKLSVALGVILQLVLIISDAYADRVTVPFLAQPDIYRRTMGWKAMSTQVRQTAVNAGASTIVADHNSVIPSLVYYLRNDRWPILAWPVAATPANHFELDRPLTSAAAEPVLFVSDRFLPSRLADFYSSVEVLAPIDVATGPHSRRAMFAYKLSGVRSNIGPLTPTPR